MSYKKLIHKQQEAFQNAEKERGCCLPYIQQRDRTFAQYVGHYFLIKLEAFVKTLAEKKALTVCDGRGIESTYLKSQGLYVTGTDLCAAELAKHKACRELDEYGKENAEQLSFANEAFDWGMVRAGLHHLPRPLLGLYELLRVSREGVIFLEGHDTLWLRLLRRFLFPNRDWENSGNYVYRFKRREIEKICLALHLPGYAYSTRLLVWRRSQETIIKGSWRYRIGIWFSIFCNVFFKRYGNLFCAIIIKNSLCKEQVQILKRKGFRFVELPSNPFLKEIN